MNCVQFKFISRRSPGEDVDDKEGGYEQLQPTEPNYETLRHHSHADPYATLGPQQPSTESESDPNYESVRYLDVRLDEPPYQRLEGETPSDTYEHISTSTPDNTPDYQRISDTTNGNTSNGSHSLEITTNDNVEDIIQKNTEEHMYFQV